jgi:hypothetical protein
VLRKLFFQCRKTFFKGFPEESRAKTFEALIKARNHLYGLPMPASVGVDTTLNVDFLDESEVNASKPLAMAGL